MAFKLNIQIAQFIKTFGEVTISRILDNFPKDMRDSAINVVDTMLMCGVISGVYESDGLFYYSLTTAGDKVYANYFYKVVAENPRPCSGG